MLGQNGDEVRALIENSKLLIEQLNELLEGAGAPIRFTETPVDAGNDAGRPQA